MDAKQLMQLLMLGVRTGEHVVVTVSGPDEDTAAGAIRQITRTF